MCLLPPPLPHPTYLQLSPSALPSSREHTFPCRRNTHPPTRQIDTHAHAHSPAPTASGDPCTDRRPPFRRSSVHWAGPGWAALGVRSKQQRALHSVNRPDRSTARSTGPVRRLLRSLCVVVGTNWFFPTTVLIHAHSKYSAMRVALGWRTGAQWQTESRTLFPRTHSRHRYELPRGCRCDIQ